MRLEYKTKINKRNVTMLHNDDFYPCEIEDCIISWSCRISMQREGLTDIRVDVKKIEIYYYRLDEKGNRFKVTRECEFIEQDNLCLGIIEPHITRIRFIDKNPNPSIKPVGLWVNYEDGKYSTPVVEFTK